MLNRLIARRWIVAPPTLGGLAVAPAPGNAAQTTFRPDLTPPANISQARQADTAYWQTAFADARNPTSPATGQITSFKLKGIALANPVPGIPGGETMFHLQALRPRPDGTFLILRSSQAFFLPPKGTDPQTITSAAAETFVIVWG